MKLTDYLELTGKSQAEFAREIQEPPPLVNNWLSGHRRPGGRKLAKIEAATDGRVLAADFYF